MKLNKKKLFLTFFATTLFSTQSLATAFSDKIKDISQINSTFKQEIYDQNDNIIQKSSGMFALDKRYGFKWEVSHPYSEHIIFNKEKLYIYDPDLQQVRIENIVGSNNFLSLFFMEKENQNSFSSEKIDDNSYMLTPTENKSGMGTQYLVTFENNNIEEVTIKDDITQKTVIYFGNNKNRNFNQSDFNFTLYNNIDVISSDFN